MAPERWLVDVLKCPITGDSLTLMSVEDLERRWGAPARRPGGSDALEISGVLVGPRQDYAYPVVGDIPLLLAPERLYPGGDGPSLDVSVAPYDEAYAEQPYYSAAPAPEATDVVVAGSTAYLRELADVSDADRAAFPDPWWRWVGNATEITASEAAFRHLAPTAGLTALQLGGNGLHGLTLLASGARRVIVVCPILNELLVCRDVARDAGVLANVGLIVGIGEELPLADGCIDIAFSPASVHHMHTELAFPEINRVLAKGGRFASIDVYRAPLYRIGIKLFGKADRGVKCQPLDPSRLASRTVFDDVELVMAGSFFRYLMVLLARLGRLPSRRSLYRMARAEDRMAKVVPGLRKMASIVAVLATKQS